MRISEAHPGGRLGDASLLAESVDAWDIMNTPRHLTCDNRENPQGIDSRQPRLGWQLPAGMQAAYQLRVEKCVPGGEGEQGWDSGKVDSADSLNARYAGPTLEPLTWYRWQVRVWTDDGTASGWSEPACWLTGMLDASRWQGVWVSDGEQPPPPEPDYTVHPRDQERMPVPDEAPALYLRKAFAVERAPARAVLVWCGLGYCEMTVNGAKPIDEVLFPPFTDYSKRVLYRTADVTRLLSGPGTHVLGAVLGNGFFNLQVPDLFQLEKAHWKQSPRLLAELHLTYADGTQHVIRSDASWKLTTGPIRFNCIRGGETIDANRSLGFWTARGYNDGDWQRAVVVSAPAGRLVSQSIAPIRVMERIEPASVRRLPDNRVLADFGGNMIGWTALDICDEKAQRITFRYGEALNADGSLNRNYASSHTYGRYQQQECILSGGNDRFEPRFAYHGFRYVEAEGLDSASAKGQWTARRVHTDLRRTGVFECSNADLNKLHDAALRTLQDCSFSGPTAEAVREKVVWPGDGVWCMRSFFSLFDAGDLYRKTIHDVLDTQDGAGHVPPVVPTSGWGRPLASGEREYCDDPISGMAFVEMAVGLHTWYGDRDILDAVCDAGLKYLDYLSGTAEDGLVDWSLGDWMDKEWAWPKGPGLTPVCLTGTLFWYRLAGHCSRICGLLGRRADASRCGALAGRIGTRFLEAFAGPKGIYATGSQTAQALPLFYGAVDPGTEGMAVDRLVEAVRAADGHLTTGFMGAMPVLNMLCDHGYGQLAYDAVTKPEGSGWLWQLEGDRPTLAESIHPHLVSGTHHHQYSACVAGWLYSYLAGIRPDKNHPGFEQFFVRPVFPAGLDRVRASIEGPRGPIEVEWKRTNEDQLLIRVAVPGNSRADLVLPQSDGPVPLEPGTHHVAVQIVP